jgi:hypothetical protein
VRVAGVVGRGVGLLFEIWIVDASILQPTSRFLVGVGCLFVYEHTPARPVPRSVDRLVR